MTQVKICGLTTPETVRAAVSAGADWIGFVFVEASPRAITLDNAIALLPLCQNAQPVALIVNADDTQIDALNTAGFAALQLHGSESPTRMAEIQARFTGEVWRALGVATREDLRAASAFYGADRLLLDAKPPQNATRTGGHGTAFDWSILEGFSPPCPWMLAGGLTPETVSTAIAQTKAPAVDVSSGVESAPGIKDVDLINAFTQAAKR